MSAPNSECHCCKALWIEFELAATLTIDNDKANATVVSFWQGESPPTTAGVLEVHNLQKDDTPGKYVFSGVAGDRGLACYDDHEDKYRIVVLPNTAVALVQIWHSGNEGDLFQQNQDGLHPARLRRLVNGVMTTLGDVWVRFVDFHDSDAGATIAEHGRYHLGMYQGSKTSGTETRPLFVVDIGEQTFLSKPAADIAKGSSGTVVLYNRNESSSGVSVTAKALGMEVKANKWTTTVRMRGGFKYYVGCWEV